MSLDAAKPKAGEFLFVMVFVLLSAFLLTELGEQTRFSAKGKLFAQPAVWPAVGVIGMTLFGGLHILLTCMSRAKDGVGAAVSTEVLTEVSSWLRGVEFAAWFMIYVFAVPGLGYLLSTVIFTALLALRMGYRKPRTILFAALAGLCIVLIFKTMLAVKIPGGAIYNALPDMLRNFMIVNF